MRVFLLGAAVLCFSSCSDAPAPKAQPNSERALKPSGVPPTVHRLPMAQGAVSPVDWRSVALDTRRPFTERLSAAAMERLSHSVVYDPAYIRIPYPMGDVPASQGVCTDEVIRAYRTLGIDLQRLVHEDMRRNFSLYPRHWGLNRPDPNIDHRRVPNLMTFFTRHGERLPVSANGLDYKTGDIVTWMLPGNLPHIGLATAQRTADGQRPMILHNIGRGPQLEDMLFSYPITGRFAFSGAGATSARAR